MVNLWNIFEVLSYVVAGRSCSLSFSEATWPLTNGDTISVYHTLTSWEGRCEGEDGRMCARMKDLDCSVLRG